MFGGAGVYADGVMFGLVADGIIYLKAGDSNAAMFDREALPPFPYARGTGQGIVMSYRRMPDRLYDDPDELAVWARAALAVAQQPKTRARATGKKDRAASPRKAVAKKSQPKPRRKPAAKKK